MKSFVLWFPKLLTYFIPPRFENFPEHFVLKHLLFMLFPQIKL